jgi:ApaG protein
VLDDPIATRQDLAHPAFLRFTAGVPSAVTDGVRVDAQSMYLAERSDPVVDRYVFAYRITITNESEMAVQLVRRHWYITDAMGVVREVEGEGVVGEQPIMDPGESHEYTSGAELKTPTGNMRGTYEMHREDGSVFAAAIPEFQLRMPRTLH